MANGLFRKIRRWWLCRKYVLCHRHFEPMECMSCWDGIYWICRACEIEDHEQRMLQREFNRVNQQLVSNSLKAEALCKK